MTPGLMATVSTSLGFTVEKFCFLCKNSSFLLAFLLKAEGLAFFLVKVTGLVSLLLVSKEKVKSWPIATEKLKA